MKQARRPTRRQKIEIERAGLTPANWLVERDTTTVMVLVHRHSGTIKRIKRGA